MLNEEYIGGLCIKYKGNINPVTVAELQIKMRGFLPSLCLFIDADLWAITWGNTGHLAATISEQTNKSLTEHYAVIIYNDTIYNKRTWDELRGILLIQGGKPNG